jgi:hypothetical protein
MGTSKVVKSRFDLFEGMLEEICITFIAGGEAQGTLEREEVS